MDCSINLVNTKALISCVVTAQLICIFVFAYVKIGFLMSRLNYVLVYVCVVLYFCFCQIRTGGSM